jgi:hypothetical protein
VSVYWPMGIESKGRHSRMLRGGAVNCVFLELLLKPDTGVSTYTFAGST